MSVHRIPGTKRTYHLISFDADGNEVPDVDGARASDTAVADLTRVAGEVTDVFILSHGWQGDYDDAVSQYDRWLAAADPGTLGDGIRPFVIGVHWPSKAWSDREPSSSGTGLLGPGDDDTVGVDGAVAAYAARLGLAAGSAAQDALREVIEAAAATGGRRSVNAGDELPDAVAAAYDRLAEAAHHAEAPQGGGEEALAAEWSARAAFAAAVAPEETARPDAEMPAKQGGGFVPPWARDGVEAARADDGVRDDTGLLGGAIVRKLRDAILAPLRQLTFWHAKDQARRLGESGMRELLETLMEAAPDARIHLNGHSFGTVVLSSAVRGPGARPVPPPRPVDSLFLVQGAVSLWAFAAEVPESVGGGRGYLADVLRPEFVSGTVVATTSRWDYAVGRAYPLAVGVAGEYLLDGDAAPKRLPKFGGLGAFGVQGVAARTLPGLQPGSTSASTDFVAGTVYNIDASAVIRTLQGPAGAHNDLGHPELVWLGWRAAVAGR